MTPLALKPDFTEESFRAMIAPLMDGTRGSLTFTTVHLTKAGERVPVEVFLQYVKTTGEMGRFVAIVRDIAYSTPNRPVIPRESGHRFHFIPASDSRRIRPPTLGSSDA